MKKLLSIFSSMNSMVIMILIFAAAIGYATFIENDYGTMTAKAEVFNSRWFEALMGLLAINLMLNMYKFRMFSVKKAPIFMFHLSFLIILLGAAITRYAGYEGTMHIREGEVANTMTSAENYFTVSAKVADKVESTSKPLFLSKKSHNSLSSTLEIDSKKVEVDLIRYIPDAIETLEESDEGGFDALDLMVAANDSSEPIRLKKGESYENSEFALDYESGNIFLKPTISIYSKDGELYMKHDMALKFLKMDTKEQGEIPSTQDTKLEFRTLFGVDGGNFVVRKHYKHAKAKIVSNPNASAMRPSQDALVFNIKVADVSQEVMI
ncbi:MAG: cytochrome c biogenesis protein ResB, partial [Sulfurimonas sp.]